MKHGRANRYHWFTGESLEELKEYLNEGTDRLEVHQHGDDMNFLCYKDGELQGETNESHVCPPQC